MLWLWLTKLGACLCVWLCGCQRLWQARRAFGYSHCNNVHQAWCRKGKDRCQQAEAECYLLEVLYGRCSTSCLQVVNKFEDQV